MVTMDEIRKIGQGTKPANEVAEESWYSLHILRKVSPYFSKFFTSIGVSANQVTTLSIICGLIGSFLLIFGNYTLMIISCIFYQFWNIFDAVDGEVARVTKTKSMSGKYLESINDVLMECSFIVFAGIGVSIILREEIYFILGLIFAFFNCLLRYGGIIRDQLRLLRFGSDITLIREPRQSLPGKLYKRTRSYFISTGIYWVLTLIVLMELILPYNLNIFMLGIPLNPLSLYILILGLVWSFRCIISLVNNYRTLKTIDSKPNN